MTEESKIQTNNPTEPSNDGQKVEETPEAPVRPQEPIRDEKGRIVAGSPPINPAGKPPGTKHLTTKLKEYLKEFRAVDPKTGQKVPLEDALVQKVTKMALDGNERMINLLWDRIEGKPTQPVDFDVNKEGIGTLTEFFKAMGKPAQEQENEPTGTDTNKEPEPPPPSEGNGQETVS